MVYSDVYIFVEGPEDQALFDRKIKYKIDRSRRRNVRILTWSKRPKDEIDKLIDTCRGESGSYMFISDFDSSEFKCKSTKKDALLGVYKKLDAGRIFFVIRKIEGWYLAGLSDERAALLGINVPPSTDNIGKKRFSQIVGKRFESEYDAKMEILRHFSIEAAKSRNISFKYFCRKNNI